MRFVVLGGYGIIGKAVVRDLFAFARHATIIIAGRNYGKARRYAASFHDMRVKATAADIQNSSQLAGILRETEVCINCVQYPFNLDVMRACLAAKVHYLDLGGLFHMTLEQVRLDNDFKLIGKTAILGMGAAPGLSNMLASYGASFLSHVESIEIVFANKDTTRYQQQFVLPYSFKTLVAEYTREPAVLRAGKTIFVPPRSGSKNYYLGKEFGTHSAFLTLHSEIATLPSSLRDKGLRQLEFRAAFPANMSETIEQLIALGFTSSNALSGWLEAPIIDVTSALMDKLIPSPGTRIKDKEIIRVIVSGEQTLTLDAITASDGTTPAGVIDTAVPCSIVAQLLASAAFHHGIVLPESLPAEKVFSELARRNIHILKNGKRVN
ncbi:MAG TPA: saccharopine dehydrogenase NADP-binding domain-containing protein [Candidatus Nanoarchaeia archaeon]|nr:saccharopine dehydrogenase NADP-binding domain-containing protein [Candidatus Nanoarchaeia archaeon]